MTRPHILLAAYQCAPGGGSVSQIGWEWYSRLSGHIPVTLVTHSRNRRTLEDRGAPLAGSEITYIDTEWFAGPLHRFAKRVFPHSEHAVFVLSSLDFFLFDAVAVWRLRKRRKEFDVVHAVTPVSPLAVTRLHRLGVPLIVGPWNGGMSTPGGFSTILKSDSGWIYRIRLLRGLFDFLTGCTRKASRILTATAATDRCLPSNIASERMVENGVDLELFRPEALAPPSVTTPLRVLFVGRLIAAKGISMLLDAATRIRATIPLQITIVGAGTLRDILEAQVQREDLQSVVMFRGAETQAKIAVLMRQSHVLCLPSVRESGGAVLLEAMASATPAITVAHGGPGELIDDDVGRALEPASPEALTQGIADALCDVYRNPDAWRQRGLQGRSRAEELYGWPARIHRAIGLYQSVCKEKDELSSSRRSRHNRTRVPSPEHTD